MRARPLFQEPLEDRRLLAIDLLPPVYQVSAVVGAEQAIELAAPQGDVAEPPALVSLGEYYWADGRQIPLSRLAGQVAVGFDPAGGLAGEFSIPGWTFVDSPAPNVNWYRSTDAAADVSDLPLADISLANFAAWSSPVFYEPTSGLWQIAPNELVVALSPDTNADEFFAAPQFRSFRPLGGTTDQFVVTLSTGGGADALAAANRLEEAAGVEWATPNFLAEVHYQATPNDTLFGSQWHLNNTGQTGALAGADAGLVEAWDTTTGSREIVIAVFDDGVQVNHPDLAANIWVNPYEIAGNGQDDDGNGWVDDVHGLNLNDGLPDSNDPSPSGSQNHGTSVSGVAAAVGNNNLGVSGASWSSRIMPIKIGGSTSIADYAESIYYAAGRTKDGLGTWRGADIGNHSYSTSPVSAVTTAFNWAADNGRGGLGMGHFAATGNSANASNMDSYFSLQTGNQTKSAGTWSWVLSYKKDAANVAGDDTLRMARFHNSDGSVTRFDAAEAPSGWNLTPLEGEDGWEMEDNPALAHGSSRRQVKPVAIGASDEAFIMGPSFTITGSTVPSATAVVARSCHSSDRLWFYLYNHDTSELHSVGYFSGANPPRQHNLVAYPASLASTIAVGASTDWDYRSNYSQWGPELDFVAPSSGGYSGITTTDRTGSAGYNGSSGAAGDYTSTSGSAFGGTSSATPFAAGVAALLLSKNPNLTDDQLRQHLSDSADEIGGVTYTSGYNTWYGHGRLNADAALDLASADAAGPTVTAVALSDDTGASSGDRITTDPTPVLTFTFSERTVWSGSDITVLAPDGSTITPESYFGSGTKELALVLPTLSQSGEYTVTLNGVSSFTDQALNKLNDGENEETTFTFDIVRPTVASIQRAGASPTGGASVDFTVTFSEPVTGVSTGDFVLDVSGVSGASISGVSGGGAVYLVTVNTGTGEGSISIDFDTEASGGVSDLAGNVSNASFTAGDSYAIDRTAPSVVSILRADPNPTGAASVNFTVTFSEPVTGVAAGDFVLDASQVSGASIAAVSGSGSSYTVEVNTGSGDGLVSIDFDADAGGGVSDAAANTSTADFTAGEIYTVDKTRPTVTSIVRADANPTTAASVNFTVSFSELVTGVTAGDFVIDAVGLTGAAIDSVSGSGATYSITVSTGAGAGTLSIDFDFDAASGAADAAGNVTSADFTAGEAYTVNPVVIGGWAVGDFATGGPAASDGGNALAVHVDGSVYSAGSFYYEGDSGTNPGAADIYLARHLGDGALAWRVQLGGAGNDRAHAVAVDATGDVYVTGVFQGEVDFDPGAGEALKTSAGGGYDVFVLKLNAAGQFVNVATFGQSGGVWDIGSAIAVSGSSVFVAGVFGGTVDFNPHPSQSLNLSSNGGGDVFVLQLATDLSYGWAKRFGGGGSDAPATIAVGPDGAVYVGGTFQSTVVFDPNNSGNTAASRTASGDDGFVVALTGAGDFAWVRQLSSTGFDQIRGLAVNSDGLYFAGIFQSSADITEDGVADLISAGGFDALVGRLAPGNGGLVWRVQAGSTSDDRARGLALDAQGDVHVAGFFSGTVDFDPGALSRSATSAGGRDGFLWKLSADGGYDWARRLGAAADDEAKAIALHSSGQIYSTGYFQNTVSFFTGPGAATTLASNSGKDLFVWSLSPLDIVVDSVRATGGSQLEVAYRIDGAAAEAFDLAFYRSTDTSLGAGDVLLDTVRIDAAGDLSPGEHVKLFDIGSSAGQVSLPGAGAAEVAAEYYLLAVADPANERDEMDSDAAHEDNTQVIAGAYHPTGGKVFVQGGAGNDAIVVQSVLAPPGLVVNLNGTEYAYADGDVTSIEVRALAGDDSVLAPTSPKRLWIHSGSGNDLLEGGAANDTLIGGPGDDRYLFDTDGALGADTLNEADGGFDTLDFTASTAGVVVHLGLTTSQTVNSALSVTLSSSSTFESVLGGAGGDTLNGNSLANVLQGGGGNDALSGGTGNDVYLFDVDGPLGADSVSDSSGVDTLDFSATSTAGLVVSLATTSQQTVHSNLQLTLSSTSSLENLIGGDANDSLTGNSLANLLIGGPGNDSLAGGGGNDTFRLDADSPLGADTLSDSGGADTIDFSLTTGSGVAVNLGLTSQQTVNSHLQLTLASATAFENLIGGAGADQLTGNSLANSLTGGAGDDTLSGGSGDDNYQFDADTALGADSISDSGGIDTLNFASTTSQPIAIDLSLTTAQAVSPTLQLTLASATSLENVVGGDLADLLIGNSLANSLTGGAGGDTLTGGAGNDTLTGGAGNDVLAGESGDDRYLFDTDGQLGDDEITETAGQGIDTLDFASTTTKTVTVDLASVDWQAVNANLDLRLSSADGLDSVIGGNQGDTLRGNALANSLTGSGGADLLEGRDGADTLLGGGGADTLIGGDGGDAYPFDVDGALGSDSIVELSADTGLDTINFAATTNQAVSLDLSLTSVQTVHANLSLQLSSGDSIENLIGGSKNDTLTGNSLNNVITGGPGSDTLQGAAGDDVFVFDVDAAQGSDILNDSAGADWLDFSSTTTKTITVNLGLTTPQSVNGTLLTLTLGPDSIEHVLGGAKNDVLTGNGGGNILLGGGGNDTLTGHDGRDLLIGGGGADAIQGGAGDDLLLGGRSTYHSESTGAIDRLALAALFAEWSRLDAVYADRIDHLQNASGLNAPHRIDASTVSGDSSAVDQLFGEADSDWYVAGGEDATAALEPGEIETTI